MENSALIELVEEIVEIRDLVEALNDPPWFDDFTDDEVIEIIS